MPIESSDDVKVPVKHPQEHNLIADALNFCLRHPLETVSTAAGIGLTAYAVMRAPVIAPEAAEGAAVAARSFLGGMFRGGRPLTAVEQWRFSPKPLWVEGANGTKLAERGSSKLIQLADGTLKQEYEKGSYLLGRTYHNEGGVTEQWLNGLTRTYKNGRIESTLADGRKIISTEENLLKLELPNGTTVERLPDLTTRITKQNGLIMRRDPYGASYMKLPGGDSLHINPDGSRELFMRSDGITKMFVMKPGSSNYERLISGQGGVKFEAVTGKLPFTKTDPVQHELKKLLGGAFLV